MKQIEEQKIVLQLQRKKAEIPFSSKSRTLKLNKESNASATSSCEKHNFDGKKGNVLIFMSLMAVLRYVKMFFCK